VGRTRGTTAGEAKPHGRTHRARAEAGDPFGRRIARVRLRSRLFKVWITLVSLAVTAAVTALIFSLLGDR
jgi:hypothetical protein